MEGLTQRFTQKLGPFPLWTWALIILALVVGYMYFTKTGFFSGAGGGAASGAINGQGYDQSGLGGGASGAGGANSNDVAALVPATSGTSPRGGSVMAQSTSGDPLYTLNTISPVAQAPVVYSSARSPVDNAGVLSGIAGIFSGGRYGIAGQSAGSTPAAINLSGRRGGNVAQ